MVNQCLLEVLKKHQLYKMQNVYQSTVLNPDYQFVICLDVVEVVVSFVVDLITYVFQTKQKN